MFVSRLLLPATLVLMPLFTTCSWAQNYSAMQAAYGGAFPAAARQFSLGNQSTQAPSFPDHQGNDYTAMSPDSWGNPATRRNQPQTTFAPSFPAPSYSGTSYGGSEQTITNNQGISGSQNFALDSSSQSPELEQQSKFTPLTNTGDHRSGQVSSYAASSASQPSAANSSDDQPAKVAGERYAQAQDFPFDGPDASVLQKDQDVPFPFTRRKRQADFVAPNDSLSGQALQEAQQTVSSSDDSILPLSSPALDSSVLHSPALDSPIVLDSQDALLSSPTDGELGLYTQPRSASPTMQPSVMQTPPYTGQQPYQQQTLVQPSSQWQHPYGDVNSQASGTAFQQGSSIPQHGSQQYVPNWTSMVQSQQTAPQSQSAQGTLPNFRPDLGHRSAMPTVRNQPIRDDGKKFDHEKKKVDYPPFKEIIATGKFFYNAEVNALRPSFLGNTGLSVDGATFSESQPFEFATTYAPLIKFGFESQYGPGVELSYFNVTENANTLGGTNDGSGSVASIASVTGPGRFSRIGADNIGDTLTADHSFDLETIGLNFFKELKFPISRLNGKFGFVYANVAQSLLVEVTDAAGATAGELTNTTDFRGYGPQFALEYFRPVGHTPLTLVTSFGGKGLFGRRDQLISNDAGLVERRFGADEFITVIDFAGGIQLKKLVADGRYWTAKVGYLHQSWLGGGTAVDPQGDFGLSGFTFGIGYNR